MDSTKEIENRKRPRGITFIATISLISGIIPLSAIGLAVLLSNWGLYFWSQFATPNSVILGIFVASTVSTSLENSYWLAGGIYIFITLMLPLVQLALGIGMFMRKYWSWILAIILLLVFAVLNVIILIYHIWDYLQGKNIGLFASIMVMLLISLPIGILYYLFKPNVRSYFRGSISSMTTNTV